MVEANSVKFKNWLYIIMTIGAVVISVVVAWANLGSKIDLQASEIKSHNETQQLQMTRIVADVDDLDIEGCGPSQKNKFDVAIVQHDITSIQQDVEEMRTEQQQGFREILEKLEK